jgi:hypothetical protein
MAKNSEQKLKLTECALTNGVQVQNLIQVELDSILHLKNMLDLA